MLVLFEARIPWDMQQSSSHCDAQNERKDTRAYQYIAEVLNSLFATGMTTSPNYLQVRTFVKDLHTVKWNF